MRAPQLMCLLACVVVASPVSGQSHEGRDIRAVVSSMNGVPAAPIAFQQNKLQQLRWLSGCWERKTATLTNVEMWMQPEGEMMLGASRTVARGVTREFEQLRLEARGDTLVYTALPSRQKETEFRSMQLSDSSFMVENLKHDFPQRIIYRRRGADSVLARIEGPGPNGATRGIDFAFKRISCTQ